MPHLRHFHDGARDGVSCCLMPLPFDSQSLSTDYNRPSNLLRIAHPNSHVQIQLLISSCRHAAKFEAFSGNKVLRHEHQHSRSCALIPVSFRILRQERITPLCSSFHLEPILASLQTSRTTHQRCFDSEFCKSFASTLISKFIVFYHLTISASSAKDGCV
jgi:hypothetical protein